MSIITLTENYVFLVTKVYFKLTLFCHRKWNVYKLKKYILFRQLLKAPRVARPP